MLRKSLMVVLVLAFVSSAAQEKHLKTIAVPNGFLSGQDFLDMPEDGQRAYAMGFLDGIRQSVLLGADETKVGALHKCMGGVKASQIVAIVDKYLQEHPEKWHWDAKLTAYSALLEVCPELQERFKAAAH